MSSARRVALAGWVAFVIVGPFIGPRISADVAWPLGGGAVAAAAIGHGIRLLR